MAERRDLGRHFIILGTILSVLAWVLAFPGWVFPASSHAGIPAPEPDAVRPADGHPGQMPQALEGLENYGMNGRGEGLGLLVGWDGDGDFWKGLRRLAESPSSTGGGCGKDTASLLKEAPWILPRVQLLRLPPSADPEAVRRAVSSLPGVNFVEWDRRVQADLACGEPHYHRQWYLGRIGAEDAWEVEREGAGVVVAVVDTGVDPSHPELCGRVLPGRDLVDDDEDPRDENGHGTSVAGVIAAAGDNGLGIAGLAWRAEILPVRVLDSRGQGYYSDVIAGIRYAVDRGARVINLSLGGGSYSRALQEAVDYARGKGSVLVAAAGNEGLDRLYYPAGCQGVISVGAADRDDRPASFSNRGEGLDLLAPGVSVYTTAAGGGYAYLSGTSLAAPQVSGCLALLLARFPHLKPEEAEERLLAAAEDLDRPGCDSATGRGMLRADRTLGYAPPGDPEDAGENRYFAEGYTGPGFHTYILLTNSGGERALVTLELFGPEGSLLRKEVAVLPLSRVTFHLNDLVRPGEVSAGISVEQGSGVEAQRSMYFQYRGVEDGHTAAASIPSRNWYFAEGYTGEGFDTYFLLLNPGGEDALVKLDLISPEGGKRVEVPVPSGSRRTLRVNDVLPGREFSCCMESDVPVVAERAMYFDLSGRRGGSASAGATMPGREWFFAEGYTGAGFDEWLLLLNPGQAAVSATASFHRGDGMTLVRELFLPPRSRTTVHVDALPGLESAEVSVAISASSGEVVAERAMYFLYRGGMGAVSGGHVAVGADRARSRWVLPEGYTGRDFESWVLVANLEERPVKVRLRLLGEGGSYAERWLELPPHSRTSILENSILPGTGVSAEVEGEPGSRLVVEGAYYYLFAETVGGGSC